MRTHWARIISFSLTGVLVLMNSFLFIVNGLINTPEYIQSHLPPKPIDETAPIVNLNGSENMTVYTGMGFSDPGIEAYDDRSEITVVTDGEVDANTVGEYHLHYTVTDESGNTTKKTRVIKVAEPDKIIYLTFDDGPGPYTNELLDILKKYNVKATFFVTGAGSDEVLAREFNEGHAIGLHTASHNYSYIYQNTNNFFADLEAVQARVERVTGQKTNLMRFPGGSSNTVSRRYDGKTHIMSILAQEVTNRGYTYFDWNVSSGDADTASTPEAVYNNVVTRLTNKESVILQHDIKQFSVAAVEGIIKYGLENGYAFKKLDANSFNAHHRINN